MDDFGWLWEVWKAFEKEYKIEAEAEREKCAGPAGSAAWRWGLGEENIGQK